MAQFLSASGFTKARKSQMQRQTPCFPSQFIFLFFLSIKSRDYKPSFTELQEFLLNFTGNSSEMLSVLRISSQSRKTGLICKLSQLFLVFFSTINWFSVSPCPPQRTWRTSILHPSGLHCLWSQSSLSQFARCPSCRGIKVTRCARVPAGSRRPL